MKKRKSWITTHDTVARTMTCEFGSETKVIVDWNFGRVYKMVNGEVKPEDVHEMDDFTLNSLEELLLETEKEICSNGQ